MCEEWTNWMLNGKTLYMKCDALVDMLCEFVIKSWDIVKIYNIIKFFIMYDISSAELKNHPQMNQGADEANSQGSDWNPYNNTVISEYHELFDSFLFQVMN